MLVAPLLVFHRSCPKHSLALSLAISSLCLIHSGTLLASDLLRIGSSPRSMGMASIAAMSPDPLSAMKGNPALLSALPTDDSRMQLSLEAFYVDAELDTKLGERVAADADKALVPEGALVWPLGENLVLGAAVAVSSGMKASFIYEDPPGTLGVSYGRQRHESEYAVVNSSLALSWQATDQLALGLQLGLAWNRNRLQAPYIFQSHPGLAGLKVLVDLEVEDYAPTATLGMSYQFSDTLGFSMAYATEAEFSGTGNLQGNLGQLGLGIQPGFTYDAGVKTGLPAWFSSALTLQASPQLQLGLQLDWIRWSDTFDSLPITLTNGSNADLNGFLASTSILDTAPLDWDDQLTLHLGAEQSVGDKTYRWGYEYSTVPTPTQTMTVMTAAIFRHALSVGTSVNLSSSQLDLYYRYSFSGGKKEVRSSTLLGGEHNNTGLELQLHSVGIGLRF